MGQPSACFGLWCWVGTLPPPALRRAVPLSRWGPSLRSSRKGGVIGAGVVVVVTRRHYRIGVWFVEGVSTGLVLLIHHRGHYRQRLSKGT